MAAFNPKITDYQMAQMLDLLSNEVKEAKWAQEMDKIVGECVVDDVGGSSSKAVLQRLAQLNIHPDTVYTSRKGTLEGKLRVHIEIKNWKTIQRSTNLFMQTMSSKFNAAQIEKGNRRLLTKENYENAAKMLDILLEGELKFEILGDSPSNYELEVIKLFPNLTTWQAAEDEMTWILKRHLSDISAIKLIATIRGGARCFAKITARYMIERLSDMYAPEVILRDKDKNIRPTASIAATISVLVPEGYRKNEIEEVREKNPNPDFVLDFPFVTVTKEGLSIKLSDALVEKEFTDSLQNLVGKEAKPIDEISKIVKKKFAAEITIPKDEVKSLIVDTLKMTPSVYDEILKVYPDAKTW